MPGDLVIVIDCGSTNVTVIAVDDEGRIIKSSSRPNASSPHPGGEEGWVVWDLGAIWKKIGEASREVCAGVDRRRIRAVTITTMGADGAPVRADGSITYPVICWQDSRTEPLVSNFSRYMDPWEVFAETGYQIIVFNTLLRLMWLRERAPEALAQAEYWLMMPGLLSHRLSGEFSLDPTSGGTMMAMDMGRRDWSDKMLDLVQLDPGFFPRWVEPGSIIGGVLRRASEETGLPEGIPVVAAGHDTQFAPIGSGASPDEAVLSSGTWEILMVRVDRFEPTRAGFEAGLIYESSALPGFFDPQLLMMGSGVLEWIREQFFADVAERDRAYGAMIGEAERVRPGSGGITMIPSFVPDTGPTKRYGTRGTILGLGIASSRAEVYRAALEGLCFQMRAALQILSDATGFQARGIRVVGGGSKNPLWNQIRADVTGLPVRTTVQKETTVLGAALFAFVGAGVFPSIDEAMKRVATVEAVFEPSKAREAYEGLFSRYMMVPPALAGFHRR